jgi:tetratricopeptide (TPR) repeat protein
MTDMKKFLLTLMATICVAFSYAQNTNYVIESTFQPLSMEEMMMAARANAYRQQIMKERFEEYQDKAYNCYNKGDFNGFIYYSDYALNTGWYNSKLYYDRGAAFEKLHEYRKAKKEYKRALKKGYYPAQSALTQCKINQKNWKKSH